MLMLTGACSVPIQEKKPVAATPSTPETTPATPTPTPIPTPVGSTALAPLDAVKSETVVTSTGHIFRGAFDEPADKQVTSSGHIFQGVFHD